MATSRLIPIHKSKGKSVSACLKSSIDYIIDPKKTGNGKYVSSYECDPKTAVAEWTLSKSIYEDITGRKQRSNIIAYQLRQSFKPGEITPELANKIAYELTMSFTKGKYAFIVATHIDKEHIHTHVDFNSTSLDCTRKFRNFWGSSFAIRRISDMICLENGLSIIENPKKSKTHYGKWLGDKKPITHSDRLRQAIDESLEKKPKNFDEFLKFMNDLGYEIKHGKHIAFKNKEQKKFIRLRSLGDKYSEEKIRNIICGKSPETEPENQSRISKNSINLLIDIQRKLDEGKGRGYEKWAKVFNLKQMSKTINFLRENNLILYTDLEERSKEISAMFDSLGDEIKVIESKLAENKKIQNHIFNYLKTKDIYVKYRQSGYSKKFLREHESEIALHKSAKEAFDKLDDKKIPSLKSLRAECQELQKSKNKAYSNYYSAKKTMKDTLLAKRNIDMFLNVSSDRKTKKKTYQQR